jgi:hypothetical protein
MASFAQRPDKRVDRTRVKNQTQTLCSRDLSGSESGVADGHVAAIAGWKSRKEQLSKQQESVTKINDEAEKVNLVSMSKKKD